MQAAPQPRMHAARGRIGTGAPERETGCGSSKKISSKPPVSRSISTLASQTTSRTSSRIRRLQLGGDDGLASSHCRAVQHLGGFRLADRFLFECAADQPREEGRPLRRTMPVRALSSASRGRRTSGRVRGCAASMTAEVGRPGTRSRAMLRPYSRLSSEQFGLRQLVAPARRARSADRGRRQQESAESKQIARPSPRPARGQRMRPAQQQVPPVRCASVKRWRSPGQSPAMTIIRLVGDAPACSPSNRSSGVDPGDDDQNAAALQQRRQVSGIGPQPSSQHSRMLVPPPART